MEETSINHWHTKSIEEVAKAFGTSLENGLPDAEVETRRTGYNELSADGGAEWVKIMIRQSKDVMNWIFFGLAIVCFVLADYVTGAMLTFISVLNLYLGFSQEYAAEQTLAALRNLSSPMADVIRDGKEQTIPSRNIIPGDILLVKEGDSVAADARLFNVSNLEADEALLTGESVPVSKKLVVLDREDEPLGDRINMLYSSTLISKGRGKAIVTSIGMQTEIGKVAAKLNDPQSDRTQLQRSLDKMYIFLLSVSVLCVIIVLATVKFKPNYDVGMYAITTALSLLPAGLTTVMTLTLVLGGKEMTRHKAVVRKLKCLETLGSVTNIFSDKTGTLTMAKMVVVRFWTLNEGYFYVTPKGLAPVGDVYRTFEQIPDKASDDPNAVLVDKKNGLTIDMTRLIECSALCNMSSIYPREDNDSLISIEDMDEKGNADKMASNDWVGSGAPTEVALQVFAYKFGMGKPDLTDNNWEILLEYQFDSSIKRMSTVCLNKETNQLIVFTKGAAERIVDLCTVRSEDVPVILEKVEILAAKGLRVMAMSYRVLDEIKDPIASLADETFLQQFNRDSVEKDLTFVGLTGIYDPPRPESRKAVNEAHRAGISVHMLTGDHEVTATAIAKEINILDVRTMSDEMIRDCVMTGTTIDAMTDEQLDALPQLPLVVARCSPETKVKMIQASSRRHNISAMTGDGVNDSPSLRIADVGISMGLNGSDVAKQASDIVLTDDNFATIIRAIAEGRRIYQNMQRFLLYYWIVLLATALMLLICLVIRDPENNTAAPFSTLQMIFLFIAFTPPASELSTQPATSTIMRQPPRPSKESIFNKEIIIDTITYSLALCAISVVALFVPLYTIGNGVEGINCDSQYRNQMIPGSCDSFFRGRATLFIVVTLGAIVIMIHNRSFRDSEWNLAGLKRSFKSRTIRYTFLFDIVCLCVFLYVDVVAIDGFRMLGITWEWGLVIGLLIALIVFGEIFKWFKRSYMKPLENAIIIED
ncbi:hypothetical protein BDB01DRAFT_717749 [Pilobolus umbonatus]|nr:hypothetical protein BDB01DRAFT_717749 [Pilobolus umbonatus]